MNNPFTNGWYRHKPPKKSSQWIWFLLALALTGTLTISFEKSADGSFRLEVQTERELPTVPLNHLLNN